MSNAYAKSCLIVGGGISGLTIATALQKKGVEVKVLDKGRGIGGRLATRHIDHPQYGNAFFDYGAQYFTVGTQQFQSLVNDWNEQGIVEEWCRGFPTGNSGPSQEEKIYYRGVPTSRSIAQHIAAGLKCQTQIQIVDIKASDSQWILQSKNGEHFESDMLVLTSPVPQSLSLLAQSQILLPEDMKQRLEQVTYSHCIAVLAFLENASRVPSPGAMWLEDEKLAWIACNEKKGSSPDAHAVTLHATSTFSTVNWTNDREEWVEKRGELAEQLIETASQWLGS